MPKVDDLDVFMREQIAERNLLLDTWFVFRSLKGSVVPKEFVDGVVKRYVSEHPKAAVLTGRMEIVPADHVWVTSLLIETVEELRYIPDNELR